jgi:hypothetical protein
MANNSQHLLPLPNLLIPFEIKSIDTTYILHISNSTQAYDTLVGAVVDWNTNGFFDIIFPNPSSATKCPADTSCAKNPYYASKFQIHFNMSAFAIRFIRKCIVTCVTCRPSVSAYSMTAFGYLAPLKKRYSHIVAQH